MSMTVTREMTGLKMLHSNVIHDLLENFHFRDLPVKEHAAEYLAEIDRLAGRYGVSLDSDEILELLKSCVQVLFSSEDH